MPNDPTTATSERGLVYIHGAGLDTWIWEPITQVLDGPHLPASFPGRGERAAVRNDRSLQEYVDHVRRQVEAWPVERVIVVTHSIGGLVGLELVSELSDSVEGFVGICAAIPKPGGSFLSCYPFHRRVVQQIIVRLVGTKPPDSAIRRSLGAGLSDEQTRRIVDQFTPESRRLFTDGRTAEPPDVPTLYVKTTADEELSPSVQDTMIANLRAEAVATVDAGHLPMLGTPHEVAEALHRFGESISE